jgi:ASC-1-like (ASCH) protein
MNTYNVAVKEVHYNNVEVEAESKSEALDKVREMYGGDRELSGNLEFSHLAIQEEWMIDDEFVLDADLSE